MIRIYASSGGGIRIGGTFGALLEGEAQGRFSPTEFDYYVGTSAGSFDAALTANGWTAKQKANLFLNTDFGRFFTSKWIPFSLRKTLALRWPMSLSKLHDFYASLGGKNPYGPPLRFKHGLLVNTVDAEENISVVYCTEIPQWGKAVEDPKTGKFYTYRPSLQGEHKKFIRWEVGNTALSKALTRSAVLPGLIADDPRFMDGGISENPLLSILPCDAHILLMHLGYAGLVPSKGDTIPRTLLDRFLYAFEFKAYSFAEHLLERFESMQVISPKILNIDTAAFHLSREEKQSMLDSARANTQEQWLTIIQKQAASSNEPFVTVTPLQGFAHPKSIYQTSISKVNV